MTTKQHRIEQALVKFDNIIEVASSEETKIAAIQSWILCAEMYVAILQSQQTRRDLK